MCYYVNTSNICQWNCQWKYFQCATTLIFRSIFFNCSWNLSSVTNFTLQDGEGNLSRMADVIEMYERDKRTALRRAPRLTQNHMAPDVSMKMRVSLAAQVFSHSTSAALTSMENELPPTASNTAKLLKMFNQIFDFLNSTSLTEIGSRRVALRQLWHTQREQAVAWINKIESLSFIPLHGKRRTVVRSMPFKKGWLISLQAIVSLIDDCFRTEEIFFVRTRLLNQDILEVGDSLSYWNFHILFLRKSDYLVQDMKCKPQILVHYTIFFNEFRLP